MFANQHTRDYQSSHPISLHLICALLPLLTAAMQGQVPAPSAETEPRLVLQGSCSRANCVSEWLSQGESLEARGTAQNFADAAVYFRKAADAGNPSAQAEIGRLYLYGLGVQQSQTEAFRWTQRSALGGSAPGQVNLALFYLNGIGTPPDDKAAAHWLQIAASQNFPGAEYNLGMLYRVGRGVPQDYDLAVRWFRRAEKHHFVEARSGLGLSYETGQGVTKDLGKAVKWYEKAVSGGYSPAKLSLALLICPENSPFGNCRRAASLLMQAANDGSPAAAAALASFYMHGIAVAIDRETAGMWLLVAKFEGFSSPLLDRALLQFDSTERDGARTRAEQWMKNRPAPNLLASPQSVGIAEILTMKH
jgi:uncharacterized protein